MILGRFTILGHSMEPTYKFGETVIVLRFLKIKKGDVVVFKYNGKNMIKRVEKIQNNYYILEGDNKKDSLYVGKISRHDIIGKVIFKI